MRYWMYLPCTLNPDWMLIMLSFNVLILPFFVSVKLANLFCVMFLPIGQPTKSSKGTEKTRLFN
jgi:hypothetical protein